MKTSPCVALPIALGIPTYSIVWGAMAATFVTGLCTATFLPLFVVPIQWALLMALTEQRKQWHSWARQFATDFRKRRKGLPEKSKPH